MPRMSKIEAAGKENEVRKLAGKGFSSRQIATALSKQGVDVTHPVVSRFLKQETIERRVEAQHVAAEQAREAVPLATNAVRQVLEMNLGLAVKLHEQAASDDPKHKKVTPMAVAGALTKYSSVAVQAARTLSGMTLGKDDGDDVFKKLNDRVGAILRSKKNAGTDAPEPSEAPPPPPPLN